MGIVFFIIGLLLGIARFKFGIKPESLDFKMFAFYSFYLETKYMEFIGNNFSEEITGLLIVAGLFFMVFARERIETPITNLLRLKAFFISAYLCFAFIVFALLFTFGFAFIYLSFAYLGFGFITYLVTFRILVYKNRSKETDYKQVGLL